MKRGIALLLSIFAIMTVAAAAGQKPATPAAQESSASLSVGPRALAPLVDDKRIKLMLKDGTYVEGKVFSAGEEKLTIKVKHSEPRGRLKKGETEIPTHDISVVYMKKKGAIALPIILGVAGGFGGFLAGTYAGYQADSYGLALGLGISLTAAAATGGAYLGSEAAKKPVTINVLSPKPSSLAGGSSKKALSSLRR